MALERQTSRWMRTTLQQINSRGLAAAGAQTVNCMQGIPRQSGTPSSKCRTNKHSKDTGTAVISHGKLHATASAMSWPSVQIMICDRERRKQKFVEMEQAIDALAAQTKDMNSLRNQHHMLQVLCCWHPCLPSLSLTTASCLLSLQSPRLAC